MSKRMNQMKHPPKWEMFMIGNRYIIEFDNGNVYDCRLDKITKDTITSKWVQYANKVPEIDWYSFDFTTDTNEQIVVDKSNRQSIRDIIAIRDKPVDSPDYTQEQIDRLFPERQSIYPFSGWPTSRDYRIS